MNRKTIYTWIQLIALLLCALFFPFVFYDLLGEVLSDSLYHEPVIAATLVVSAGCILKAGWLIGSIVHPTKGGAK